MITFFSLFFRIGVVNGKSFKDLLKVIIGIGRLIGMLTYIVIISAIKYIKSIHIGKGNLKYKVN